MIALVYNWWNVLTRLAQTDSHMEAVKGRRRLVSVTAASHTNPGIALTPALKSGVMTGLSAPAAGKPTDADKNGVWDYGAANSVGLKIALTRATGIFKGSFLS